MGGALEDSCQQTTGESRHVADRCLSSAHPLLHNQHYLVGLGRSALYVPLWSGLPHDSEQCSGVAGSLTGTKEGDTGGSSDARWGDSTPRGHGIWQNSWLVRW